MFVSIKVKKELNNYLSIPKNAIIFKDNHFYVYLLKDGQVIKKEVQLIGDAENDKFAIVDGLNKDDRVILNAINVEGE